MKLFQYWDTGEPPEEVAGWIDGYRVMNPEMKHRLYDRDRASWFIGKHVGERQRRAFEACAVPAMQSDYFRAAALLTKGGVYIDADCVGRRPLRELFDRVPYAAVLSFNGHLQLGLMMFRAPGDALIAAWLERITRNVETSRGGDASVLTGPLAIREVIEEAPAGSPVGLSVAKITPLPWSETGAWVGLTDAAYKRGPRHWENWRGSPYSAPPVQP